MHNNTLQQLRIGLKNKKFSAIELVEHYIKRIKKSTTNSFITINEKNAMYSAKLADIKNARNQYRTIAGIPFAHKDVFCTKNIRTTCATKILENFIPTYDATIHKKLKKNGYILLGKTNMDEFAMGYSGEHSVYGNVKNIINTQRTPGGSSSGSASSVAEKITPFATGSDTGGSIRQPAAFCGVVGLKPTYGRISRYGLIAFASSLDHCGILAQTVEDCCIVLNKLAGYDSRDLTSINLKNNINFLVGIEKPIKDLVVGIPIEFFEDTIDIDIYNIWLDTIKKLRYLGVKIKYITLKKTKLYTIIYRVIAAAECMSNLARFDTIYYGKNTPNKQHFSLDCVESRNINIGKEVVKRIILGNYLTLKYDNNTIYEKAMVLRKYIVKDYEENFKKVNAILHPTTPTTAFLLGSKKNESTLQESDKYVCSANLTGMPAISIPAGVTKHGLPVGMQLIADTNNEQTLLNIANILYKTQG